MVTPISPSEPLLSKQSDPSFSQEESFEEKDDLQELFYRQIKEQGATQQDTEWLKERVQSRRMFDTWLDQIVEVYYKRAYTLTKEWLDRLMPVVKEPTGIAVVPHLWSDLLPYELMEQLFGCDAHGMLLPEIAPLGKKQSPLSLWIHPETEIVVPDEEASRMQAELSPLLPKILAFSEYQKLAEEYMKNCRLPLEQQLSWIWHPSLQAMRYLLEHFQEEITSTSAHGSLPHREAGERAVTVRHSEELTAGGVISDELGRADMLSQPGANGEGTREHLRFTYFSLWERTPLPLYQHRPPGKDPRQSHHQIAFLPRYFQPVTYAICLLENNDHNISVLFFNKRYSLPQSYATSTHFQAVLELAKKSLQNFQPLFSRSYHAFGQYHDQEKLLFVRDMTDPLSNRFRATQNALFYTVTKGKTADLLLQTNPSSFLSLKEIERLYREGKTCSDQPCFIALCLAQALFEGTLPPSEEISLFFQQLGLYAIFLHSLPKTENGLH